MPGLWGIVVAVACSAIVAPGCGGGSSAGQPQGSSDAASDATGLDSSAQDSSAPDSSTQDASNRDASTLDGANEAALPCTNLQCRALMDNCAAQGKPATTISGVVYDPAGALPLYNAYVYIPNSTPAPIVPGSPTCTQCQAPASGDPVIGASTDKDGKFTLARSATDPWGVPSGASLPLVIQIGKWRRQLVMPQITACQDNPLPDPSTPSQKLRLPAMSSEGDMPLIAFTSGCDPAECFLRKIGIADSEFVPPGNPAGGHVVFYTGQDANGSTGGASQVEGGNTWQDTYQWWTSTANLAKYDIVFNSCECNPNDRGVGAYQAMHDYLGSGGRVVSTHYYYNWFAPPTGPTDFQSVVNWALPEAPGTYQNYYIDTTFPKGQAFADWLQDRSVTQTLGEITLADTRYDMNGVNPGTTDWIYNANTSGGTSYASMLMSFNTPTTVPAAMQCGRAVYSDAHFSGASDDSQFPNECANADPDGSHAVNEKALEFLFFDLSSCVQDNTQAPVQPPASN